MVSEVSVHGRLVHCFGTASWWRVFSGSKLFSPWPLGNRETKGANWNKIHHPLTPWTFGVTDFLHWSLFPKVLTVSRQCHQIVVCQWVYAQIKSEPPGFKLSLSMIESAGDQVSNTWGFGRGHHFLIVILLRVYSASNIYWSHFSLLNVGWSLLMFFGPSLVDRHRAVYLYGSFLVWDLRGVSIQSNISLFLPCSPLIVTTVATILTLLFPGPSVRLGTDNHSYLLGNCCISIAAEEGFLIFWLYLDPHPGPPYSFFWDPRTQDSVLGLDFSLRTHLCSPWLPHSRVCSCHSMSVNFISFCHWDMP